MRIFIRSKSGNYDVSFETFESIGQNNLYDILKAIRRDGVYRCVKGKVEFIVPFEEIEAIREAAENEI